MNFIHCPDYSSMSRRAAEEIVSGLSIKPSTWLCAATGNSTLGVYRELTRHSEENPQTFSSIGVVKLDEWAGLPDNSQSSCENYLQKHLIKPFSVPAARYVSFQGNAGDAVLECGKVEQAIREYGPIDICILGLGTNGHIGFNEPADFINPFCHLARLSPESLSHTMLKGIKDKPLHGYTLGMAAILQSKKIIFLVTGPGKTRILKKLKNQNVSPKLPASFLWLHPRVNCYLDDSSFVG